MPAPPPITLWVDPGGMTGFACLEMGKFWAGEYDWPGACDKLTGYASYWKSMLHIGYEAFTILPGTHKLSPQPEAYEFPGVIKYIARTWGCRLLKPARPSDRTTATPAELAALGWWPPGKDDAQSAAQHLLAFLKRENCVPHQLTGILAQAHAVDG